MGRVDEWQASIAENERRTALQERVEREGPAYTQQYLASRAAETVARLEAFLTGTEFAFIRQTLSNHPYDSRRLSRSYSASVPKTSIASPGVIDWPPSVLVLQWGDFVGWGPRTFHAVTGEGVTEFTHGYGLWSGTVLRSASIDSRRFIQFRIHQFAPHGPMAVASGRLHLFHSFDRRISWEQWTELARQDVDRYLSYESTEGVILAKFSAFLSVAG